MKLHVGANRRGKAARLEFYVGHKTGVVALEDSYLGITTACLFYVTPGSEAS